MNQGDTTVTGWSFGATVLSFLLVHWQVSQLNLQELIYSLLLTKQYEIPFPVCLLSFQANKSFTDSFLQSVQKCDDIVA